MPLHHELSPLQSLCELHRTLQWTGAKGRRRTGLSWWPSEGGAYPYDDHPSRIVGKESLTGFPQAREMS